MNTPVCEQIGQWYLRTDQDVLDFIGMGILYHKHVDDPAYYTTNAEGECRECKEAAPPGMRVKALLAKL
jgi:hypothetical protein